MLCSALLIHSFESRTPRQSSSRGFQRLAGIPDCLATPSPECLHRCLRVFRGSSRLLLLLERGVPVVQGLHCRVLRGRRQVHVAHGRHDVLMTGQLLDGVDRHLSLAKISVVTLDVGRQPSEPA